MQENVKPSIGLFGRSAAANRDEPRTVSRRSFRFRIELLPQSNRSGCLSPRVHLHRIPAHKVAGRDRPPESVQRAAERRERVPVQRFQPHTLVVDHPDATAATVVPRPVHPAHHVHRRRRSLRTIRRRTDVGVVHARLLRGLFHVITV